MLVVVSYDVATTSAAGRRRLRRVAKICTGHGFRVQHSVFECLLDPAQWEHLRSLLLREYDVGEDSDGRVSVPLRGLVVFGQDP